MIKPTFQGEVQLAGWGESHNGGAKVTFWLSDPADLEAFRAMTVKKGNTAGHRLACVLVEIGDDEKPVQDSGKVDSSVENIKGGPLAQLAGQWCNDPLFWKFLESKPEWFCYGPVSNATRAAEAVRKMCRVESRAEIDHISHAKAAFMLLRQEYMNWNGK